MSSITNRLSDLDIQLPEPPAAVASYVPARIAGGYLYVSGQLPFSDGKLLATGPVPSVTTIEEAVHAAKFCGINALAVADDILKRQLDRIRSVVRVGVFVQSDARFDAQPKVANGVSDLVIGLTIVAIGTSLPELASSIIAARKGEHDLALGNILGSNLFNTLAVVGIAGSIAPMAVANEVLIRDIPVMVGLTLALFVLGYGFRGPGRINRVEGVGLLAIFVGYTVYLLTTTF